MKDKFVLVTGSSDGIGKQTALDLARMGARIILHGRNRERGEAARDEIQRLSPGSQVDLFLADFSSLKEVRVLASALHEQFDHLDVLVNNAATYMKERVLTEDGYEMTFAVNHLAPFLLTHLLMDMLRKGDKARIVTVSSMAHSTARLDLDNLQGEKEYKPWRAYALSKLCNILFTFELAERLDGSGMTSNCLHPGVVNTKLLRASFDTPGSSLEEGAETSVYLASSAEVEMVNGKYFTGKQVTQPPSLVLNDSLRRQFWELSARMVGIPEDL